MRSYNGWDASPDKTSIGIVPLEITVRGETFRFPGGCKGGDVHTIFTHFLPRFHVRVEPLGDGGADEWGYAYRKNRNADNLSCHASGTAVDVNSSEHPNGARRTFTTDQVTALRTLLATYDGVLKWGGDFHGTTDEMHFEINGTPDEVHRLAVKLTSPAPLKGDQDMTADEHKALVETRKIAEANGRLLGEILAELKKLNGTR
jgi:hypothetical protein